jgi:hypothetical protein
MGINYIAEMEHKSQKIDIVVAAAEKYLGVQDLTASEELQSGLSSGSCSVVLPGHWHGAAADRVKVLEWGSGFNWKDVFFLVPFSHFVLQSIMALYYCHTLTIERLENKNFG